MAIEELVTMSPWEPGSRFEQLEQWAMQNRDTDIWSPTTTRVEQPLYNAR